MLRGDAEHGRAQAARVIEGNDLLAERGELPGEAVDEVNLGSDSEHGALGRAAHQLNQPLGRAECVGLLADLPAALRVHDHLHAGLFAADAIDVLGKEALVDAAVSLP